MNELALFNSLFNNGLMDDAFDFNYKNALAPKVDVSVTDKEYTLQMDLPGLNQENVNIEINANTLTIASKKEETHEEKDKDARKYLIRERRTTSFSRSFTLPDDIDENGTKAVFKNGILTVTLNRKAAPQPKKIAIESAD